MIASPADGPSRGSLLAEGAAMVAALGTDLAELPGLRVSCLRDARLSTHYISGCTCVDVANVAAEHDAYNRLTTEADVTIVIAPEFSGNLTERAQQVVTQGGTLLSPSPEFVQLTSDKLALAEHWQAHDIPTPNTHLAEPYDPATQNWPAILKPRDGAGCCDVQRITSVEQLTTRVDLADRLIQDEHSGTHVSVSFLCGPKQRVALPSFTQHVEGESQLHYGGGSRVIAPELEQRAQELAIAALESLPTPHGYLGIDLVLGGASDGSEDVAIEVNPRLTTSYLGLRAISRNNLAGEMLKIASGECAELLWDANAITFDARGQLT